MPLITWTDKFSVGVEVLDADHRKLVGMLNDLYDSIAVGRGRDAIGRTLDGLIAYTKTHFEREEKLFAQTGYAAAEAHHKEHADLTMQVIAVQEKYRAGVTGTLSLEVMNFLKNWLINHIQGSDRKYGPHLNGKGIH